MNKPASNPWKTPLSYGNQTKKAGRLKIILIAVVLSTIVLGVGVAFAATPLLSKHLSATHAGSTLANSTLMNQTNNTNTTSNMNQANHDMDGAVKTINGLMHISVVGSTAFVVDGKGATIATDANPYGVAIVPDKMQGATMAGALKTGDIVVTNFGAKETGTTLVRFNGQMGPGRLFNTMPNKGTNGPSDEAFNALTGTDWVANSSGNNLQVFNPVGKAIITITNPLFHKPWGQTSNGGVHNPKDGAVISFFSTNEADATIDRIDVIPANGGTMFRVFQIGQLSTMGAETKIGVTWVPSLQIGKQVFKDVLLALDPAMNRIAAYPNSTTMNTNMAPSKAKGMTVFQGKPLNAPGGLTVNPLNGDLLVVNENDNNLVELNLTTNKAVGTRQLDNVPVDLNTGNGSALFGVAATVDAKKNLKVFFTDDNTNTLNVLSI